MFLTVVLSSRIKACPCNPNSQGHMPFLLLMKSCCRSSVLTSTLAPEDIENPIHAEAIPILSGQVLPSSEETPEVDECMSSTTVCTIREHLMQFYSQHNPQKIAEIDEILERYQGQEEVLLRRLSSQYQQPTNLSCFVLS
jgi:hypothetical protein